LLGRLPSTLSWSLVSLCWVLVALRRALELELLVLDDAVQLVLLAFGVGDAERAARDRDRRQQGAGATRAFDHCGLVRIDDFITSRGRDAWGWAWVMAISHGDDRDGRTSS